MIRGYDSGYDSRVWIAAPKTFIYIFFFFPPPFLHSAAVGSNPSRSHISTGRELSLELSSNSSGSGSSGSGSSSGSNSGENMVWGVIRRYGLGV